MITQMQQVLNAQQRHAINDLVAHGQFIDGEETAGWHAKGVKKTCSGRRIQMFLMPSTMRWSAR